MHASLFAETPDHLSCAMAHLMLTPNVCTVPPKRLALRYNIQPGSVAEIQLCATGSGSGKGLLVMLEISPSTINVHIYPGTQSLPAATVTAQKQMSITVLQVPF